jgi:flagellar motility protein MotE (MotC chaperone)
MIPRLHPPRLLPITIFALSGLLAVKSAELVSAAVTPTEAQPKAATTETSATPATAQPSPSGNPAQSDAAKPSEDSTPPVVADGERTVLLELRQRRLELDVREATLAARESLLAAAEQKVAARVTELQVLQKKLEALEATRQQREDVSWLGLVKVYESMKPRDAATIFNDLEMPVLLQVVDRMKEAKAAPVLAAMQPDKARDLTTRLAQMRTHRDDPGGGTVGG